MSFYSFEQTEATINSLAAFLTSHLEGEGIEGVESGMVESGIRAWQTSIQKQPEPAAPKAKAKAAPKKETPPPEVEVEKPAAAPKAKATPKREAPKKETPPEEEEPVVAPKAKAKAKATPKKETLPPPEEEEVEKPAAPKAKAKAKAKVVVPEDDAEDEPVAKPKAKVTKKETPPPEEKPKAAPKKAATCDRSVKTNQGFVICGKACAEGQTKCEPCLRLAKTKETAAPREPAPKAKTVKKQPVVKMVDVPEGQYAGKLYNPEHGILFDPDQNNGAAGYFCPFADENNEPCLDEEGNQLYSFEDLYPLEPEHLELIQKWGISEVKLEGDPEADVVEEDEGEAFDEEDDEE